MMKSFWLKVAALALLAGALAPSAPAAHLSVGAKLGGSSPVNSRFVGDFEVAFWVGTCKLNGGETGPNRFKDAVALEASYNIASYTSLGTIVDTGFSTGGIVRLKAGTVAIFDESKFEEDECVYMVEMISTDPSLGPNIDNIDFAYPDNWQWSPSAQWDYTDNLPVAEAGGLHGGGRYWYAENVRSNPAFGEVASQRAGFASLLLAITARPDDFWQCRIGDKRYETLEAALAQAIAGDTIYLVRDVDLTNSVTVDKNVTITTEVGGQLVFRRLGDCSLDIAANVVFTNVVVNGLGFAATKPMFNVAAGAKLTLATDVTVNSCVNTSGNGGAISSLGTVALDGGRIITSSATNQGGAIYAAGGTVDARGGEITGCSAEQGGGAVYLASGATLTLAGAFRAAGNAAGEAVNNVQPTGPAQIEVSSGFAGSVGVTYPAADVAARDGVQFGHVSGGGAVANRFQSDVTPTIFSATVETDGKLVWKETSWDTPTEVVMGPVVPESLSSTGAEMKMVGEDVVLIFTNTATMGTFTVPSNTYARLLCVAGGAAGGTVGIGVTKGAGGGGGAGGFYELSTTLKPGTYEVAVGAGASRVDSYAQSWVGNNGGASWIRPAGTTTNNVVSAKGGGGGGAPKDNGRGAEGGSGGGGSWYGAKALAAGTATDGYGWKGAKPAEESVGGGGGGAASASADGMGQATGEGGAGRASDITGETVVYAAGGNGGKRLDAAYVPQDGATPGAGGDGAGMPGKAGAGADGIVVVRLTKAFTPVKVPYPSFAVGVPWENGETVSPFEDLATATNRFFIAGIEGTLDVPCSERGSEKVGVDRYHFTVTLKDGYAWDDGSAAGDIQPKTFFWRVKDPSVEGQATAEVDKNVSWSEGTNATIHIESHTSPETSAKTPKVLVLGTLCDAHRLTAETIKTCLDTAAEVADVEYYFYSNVTEDGRNVFEFYEGMEEYAEEYWNEYWPEFWASRDRWEEDGYELWTEYLEDFEPNEDECYWDNYYWEDYLTDHESFFGEDEEEFDEEGWREYWEECWKDLCWEKWWVSYWNEISDYVEDDDDGIDGYWDMYWTWEYWFQYENFSDAEDWEEFWTKFWIKGNDLWEGFYLTVAEEWGWGSLNEVDLEGIPPLKAGTLAKGERFDELDELRDLMFCPQHKALYGFYAKLAQLINAGRTNEFDYVILCFDRSHMADAFPKNHEHEAEVAAFLKPFYASGRVIWMVDNESPGIINGSPAFWGTPWRPSQFKCIDMNHAMKDENIYWTTYYNDFGNGAVSTKQEKSWQIHKALFGMFDPEAYETLVTVDPETKVASDNELAKQNFKDNIISDMAHFSPEQVAATSGKANPNQVVYDDAGSVGDMVRRIILPVSYTVKLKDRINVGEDLELDSVGGFWRSGDDVDWIPLVEGENLTVTESGVEIAIKGVDKDVWIKLDLQVHDKGKFRTSIGAEYNPSTGEWEKDPNDGPVVVETVDVATDVTTTHEEASTVGGWTFYGYELTGTVESNIGDLKTGDIVVNGYSTSRVAVGANTSPQTVFRAAPGYILEKLVIDGEEVEFDLATCEWTFPYVLADHDVKVWYKPYFVMDPPPPETDPVVHVYDGTGYAPTVTNVTFTEDIPYEWFPVYSFESNGVYTAEGPQTNVVYDADGNVIPTNVYVRIAVKQPGYEEPVILDNWTGVDTVTILPREVTITFDNYVQTDDKRKEDDFTWKQTGGELVDGDEISVPGSTCKGYPEKGDHTDDTITASGEVVVVDADGKPSGNYVVHVVPGDYYYPDNEIIAEAEGVEKVYDGEPSTIDVTAQVADLPTVAELHAKYNSDDYAYIGDVTTTGVSIKYSADGGQTYTLDEPPEYTDAGTYTVPYQVTYSYSFKHGTDEASAETLVVPFETITGSADVIIHPRPVYVAADSAFKFWDGTALTDGDYTIEPATDVTGFVAGEGATFQMTGDSSQTLPGTTANTIDQNAVTPTDGTNLNNYEIHYTDGTLTVRDRLATVPEGVEKIYNGEPSTISVEVDLASGTPITSDDYTIKYSLYPDDPDSWVDDLSFVNVGVSNKVYYVVEAEGFDPVTNYAYVTIWPREIVVTADDKRKQRGEEDPELTWVVSDGTNGVGAVVGILPGEEDLVNAAVSNDVWHVIERPSAGTPEGEKPTHLDAPGYPILVDGSDYVGNYHVTYVPGALTIPAIFTSNIHGLLKINSPFANTIIPAPWKGYTRDGSPSLDIPVDRLVKPRNLTDGDMILQYSNGGVYKAWTLEKPDGGEGKWTPMAAVAQTPVVGGSTNVVSSLYVKPTGEETQKRGYGMWLVRQRPVDENNNVIPFYLYGQWMTGVETVTIGGTNATDVAIKYEGAQYDVVHDTMLADPDCTRTSVINNHQWTGFDNADTIILNTDLKQSLYCFRRERPKRSGGGWYDGWWIWGVNGHTTEGIATPAGVGFWYERRAAGDMTLRWEGPDQYMGEGRELDVWIVDHADGGDGKTHLAFKFVGEYAQDPITPAYIKELFDSHSIRYLHTTGETQAEGKAEMDRLSLNLKDNARVVPALRNGTGVNTQEELAKGWIWVTVDAPDGATEKSDKDGTGDTNGAGDLWRIVVGRGVWDE